MFKMFITRAQAEALIVNIAQSARIRQMHQGQQANVRDFNAGARIGFFNYHNIPVYIMEENPISSGYSHSNTHSRAHAHQVKRSLFIAF